MFKMIDFKNLQNFVTNYIHVASYNVPKIFKNTIFAGILVFWTLKKNKTPDLKLFKHRFFFNF